MRYEKEYLDKIGMKVSHKIDEDTMAPIVTFELNGVESTIKMTRLDMEDFKSGPPYDDFIVKRINSHITELIKIVRKKKLEDINEMD